ncbi:MAG: exopolysaccharide biosynthesis protein [Pseudomonadota bacterium]
MADLVDPNSSSQQKSSAPAPAGRLTFAVGVEDLGTLSFSFPLTFCGVVMLSPLGGVAGVPVLVGFAVIFLGAQLVLRRPSIPLPTKLRKFIMTSPSAQTVLIALLRRLKLFDSNASKPSHWITVAPFDLVPRISLIVCGIMIFFTTQAPEMRQLLGAAVLALTIALHTRKPYWALSGAALMSLASIAPIFGG